MDGRAEIGQVSVYAVEHGRSQEQLLDFRGLTAHDLKRKVMTAAPAAPARITGCR